MQKLLNNLLATTLLLGPCCALARADGGQIRLTTAEANYQLTVFTSPTPLRAGPIDISVLLQDAATHQTITDAAITIELTSPNKEQPPIHAAASNIAATNKLLSAALLELPAAGEWNVRIECTPPEAAAPITANFTMEAAPPLPPWLAVWPWFTWPFAAVILFVIHRRLVATKSARRASGGTPGASSDRRGEYPPASPRPSPSLRGVPSKPASYILSHHIS
jgi:hypothetical protein